MPTSSIFSLNSFLPSGVTVDKKAVKSLMLYNYMHEESCKLIKFWHDAEAYIIAGLKQNNFFIRASTLM